MIETTVYLIRHSVRFSSKQISQYNTIQIRIKLLKMKKLF